MSVSGNSPSDIARIEMIYTYDIEQCFIDSIVKKE